MSAKGSKKNKRQMVLLGALLLVLGYYVLHSFVFTGSGSKPKGQTQAGSVSPASKSGSGTLVQTSRQVESAATQQAKLQALMDDRSPLNLELIASVGGNPEPGKRGNIFDYYKEPIKQIPLPPPPPITITYLSPQTAVAGTPRTFPLTVAGKGFPADAQIIIDGRPRQTKRVNDTTLSTEIPPGEYGTQGNKTVEVKSQADPKLYSNPLTFIVQPSPDPPFKYVGRIGDLGVLEMLGTKEVVRLTRGSTVQGVWRIESITDGGVDVIHMQLSIKKRVVMQDKGRS